ncbi:MAG: hypothetical protein ACOYYS_10085 [Chloroflexota bacterium]
MRTDNTLYLHDQGPFWDLVRSYQLCWYGIATVYTSNETLLGKEKPLLSLGCKTRSDRVFYQHHEQILTLKSETSSQQIMYDLICLLANMAYERVKQFNDHSPEFEFFRHVRNAASHKNHFTFTKNEPQRAANWEGLIIDHAMTGEANPLQKQQCFGTFLYSGDLFFLLNDIEDKILNKWLSSM